MHWIGRYPLAETVRALVELKQEGKIRRWGMSNLDVDDMKQILALPHGKECAADQVLYNLCDRDFEYDLIPWSKRHRIPLMAYTPLGESRLHSHPVRATGTPTERNTHSGDAGMGDALWQRNSHPQNQQHCSCGGKRPQSEPSTDA